MMETNSLEIVKIPDLNVNRAVKEFIRVPWPIYEDDPVWVPPLAIERRMVLSPSSPYFQHARCCLWMAYRNGRPVGRISAQVDSLHLERYRDQTGFWGMLEAENRRETFKLLLETAEKWLLNQGMKRAMGPFNLSINQECGLLIHGFDTPPSMMMGHARPWYAGHVEACGYQKAKDLLAYTIDVNDEQPPGIRRLLDINAAGMRTRGLNKSRLQEEMDIIFGIFNDAWSENWGFIPFTEEEYQDIGKTMKFIADSRLVRIAEIDGKAAAFIVVLPNINEAIRDLDGSLLPVGWVRLLWRLRVKRPETGRILLMGVVKKYQDTLAGAALVYSLFSDINQAVNLLKMKRLELSWILEDNMIMRSILEAVGGKIYKTYRIYRKRIGIPRQ